MKRSSLVATSLTLLALAVAGALSARTADAPVATATAPGAATPANGEADLARGKYMVTVSGCNDCHTPFKMGAAGPEPDMSRMLSGHPESLQIAAPPPPLEAPWVMSGAHTNTAWAGPWGVSFTANLTPDKETGLGNWMPRPSRTRSATAGTWAAADRSCRPCPGPMYRNMTDQDLEAIFRLSANDSGDSEQGARTAAAAGAGDDRNGDRDEIVAAPRRTAADAGNKPVPWPVAVPGDVC